VQVELTFYLHDSALRERRVVRYDAHNGEVCYVLAQTSC